MAVSALLFIPMKGGGVPREAGGDTLVPDLVSFSAKPVHMTAAITQLCCGVVT